MDVWMYGCMNVVDVWMDGWMDVWMYGCMEGRKEGAGGTDRTAECHHSLSAGACLHTHTNTHTYTYTHTNNVTPCIYTHRERERERERERCTCVHMHACVYECMLSPISVLKRTNDF